jgi:hypothetical protein
MLKHEHVAFTSAMKTVKKGQVALLQEASLLTFSVTPDHPLSDKANAASPLVLSRGDGSFRPSAIFTGRLNLEASVSVLKIQATHHDTLLTSTFPVHVQTVRLVERVLTLDTDNTADELSPQAENTALDRACKSEFGPISTFMRWGQDPESNAAYTEHKLKTSVLCRCVGTLRRVCVVYEPAPSGHIVESTRIHQCERTLPPEVTVGLHVYITHLNHSIENTGSVSVGVYVRSGNDPRLLVEAGVASEKGKGAVNTGITYLTLFFLACVCFVLAMYIILEYIIVCIVSCLLGVNIGSMTSIR